MESRLSVRLSIVFFGPVWNEMNCGFMHRYFSDVACNFFGGDQLLQDCSDAELRGEFDKGTCKQFKTWFSKIKGTWFSEIKPDGHHFEEFELLFSSQDFKLLCYWLYYINICRPLGNPVIVITSSDGKILKASNKKGFVDSTDLQCTMKYSYLSAMASHNDCARALLCELSCAESFQGFDEGTCELFKKWFRKIKRHGHGQHFKEFKLLFSFQDFRDLCHRLCDGPFREPIDGQHIYLKSSDGNIWTVDKCVATAESVVLKQCVDSTGDRHQIRVPDVSSNVLLQILDFCQKKQDFGKVLETLLGYYKGWVTAFLTSNQAILHDLHKAADFLSIPSLLTLTTEATKDLVGHAFEGISEWCGNLSMSRLLSSLWVGVGEDVPDLGGN